ncbi:MAG TPA: hypothetical protein VJ927_02580 [Actinomycetota bacterium]|nr:hypothetical protein [Actinomycetota bacterium]
MSKKLRWTLVFALSAGSVLAGAAPASATCRPESKIPCESETPLTDLVRNCYTGLSPDLPVALGVCEL